MSVAVQSLGSGSSGNAFLIVAGEALVVVDCGISPRALTGGLAALGRSLADVDALLLTHEHADHVRGLPAMARAGVRVVSTPGTARAAGVPPRLREELRRAAELRLGSITVDALSVSHDAAEPCGFSVVAGGARVTVLTDLGRDEPALHGVLDDSDLVVLEANHDEAMLRRGPYPPHLKRRVMSDVGHLSNAACGAMLGAALTRNGLLPTVWLAHLSQTNNRPEVARQEVARALAARGRVAPILPLPRRGPGPVWRSDARPTVPIQLAMGL